MRSSNLTESTPKAILIAAGPRIEYWQYESEVMVRNTGVIPYDTAGLPMDWRWECSVGHFARYRDLYLDRAYAD